MFRAILVTAASLILVPPSEDKIDESLLRGTWVWGKFECGSDVEFIYRDGMLGNPMPTKNESIKYSDFYGIHKVISAKRKGDEAWIKIRPLLADRREDPTYTIIFRIENNKYVAIQSFTDQRLEERPTPLHDLDWTRCNP